MLLADARSPPVSPTACDHISFSAISTYQACPLRYYFRYVEHLPERMVSSSLVFGAAIHRAAQAHYEQLIAGEPPPGLDYLLEAFWAEWRERDKQHIRLNAGEDLDSLAKLAERTLQAFQASDLATPKGTIIAVEEELRGAIIPGAPDVLGRLDLLVESESELVLTDLKTARRPWSNEHAQDAGSQLLLYGELVKPLMDGKPLRLQFAVLTKGSTPTVTIVPVEADPQRIERTRRIAARVWRAIEAEHFFPAPSAMNCPTCPFREPCRAWRG